MQDDPRSHGLWELTAPPAPEMASLSGTVMAEVAIIGGGFAGLSAALHLAEGGARTVLLEAVEVGFGAAGRNVGLVNAGLWLAPDKVIERLGAERGEVLLQSLGDGPSLVFDLIARHAIECEAERSGTLHCAVGRSGRDDIAAREAQWRKRGAPVALLSEAETAAMTGSCQYTGALWDRRAGTIQPLAYARGLARAAALAGATLYRRSPVLRAERIGGRWQLQSEAGSVSARQVIVATDAYTEFPWPEIRREQVLLPYFNIATEPLHPSLQAHILPGRQGAWDTRQVLSSFRFDRAGRLIFGSVGALRGFALPIHRAWTRRAIHKLFPQLADVGFVAEWFGWIGMTDDNLPRLHRLAEGVIGVCGYNGRGIAPGTVFGKAMAEFLLGRSREEDLPLPVSVPVEATWRKPRETLYEAGSQAFHLFDAYL